MRILLVTQYYPPEAAPRYADVAAELMARGHEVEVLTSVPCYPLGKPYEGYKNRFSRTYEGERLTVTRVPQWTDHSRSAWRRALYYLTFALSASTFGLFRTSGADVVVVYQSAMPATFAAWWLSVWKRARFVIDVIDLWPESVEASGMLKNRVILGLIGRVMRWLYARANRINVITEGYRSKLVSQGVAREKIERVPYWIAGKGAAAPAVDEDFLRTEGLTGAFNLVYTGIIGPCQGLQVVLDAAERLQSLPAIRWWIVGSGSEEEALRAEAERRGLTSVRFPGRVAPEVAARWQAAADMLLVHLSPSPMAAVSIPSKTFNCMASGRPLLMGVEGEASDIVSEADCGVTFRPDDPEDLASSVRSFYEKSVAERAEVGRRARALFDEQYSPPVLINRFAGLLERTVEEPTVASRNGFYPSFGKRLIDIAVSATALIVLAPVFALVAVLVAMKLGRPVLFTQQRIGRDERPFKVFKFRSMTDARDDAGEPLPDAERLTAFGRLLRSTSLDELPQLWNVLRGEMSLVGPRPLLPEYLPRYSPEQARRHEVRPGVTGWSQVEGRNRTDWKTRLEQDVWYVDRVSAWLDAKIVFRTLGRVLSRRGATAEGHATMPLFTGTESDAPIRREAA